MADLNRHPTPPAAQTPRPSPPVDLADQSLSEALRVSFRILTGIMVLVVILFLLTGFTSVGSSQKGVCTLFGKVVGVADPGLAYTWPYPIGGIELVDVKEKTLTVDDFWLYETPQDAASDKPLSMRGTSSEGLRPGWEGALLTSDRNLLHVKMICKYKVADVAFWKKNVAAGEEEDLIRSAVCDAAIRAAAVYTGDSLQRSQKGEFLTAVKDDANKALGKLGAGIEIGLIQLAKNGMSWPLRALASFDDVTRARNEAEGLINDARGEAEGLLNAAAGPSYKVLVGEPWKAYVATQPASGPDETAAGYDLVAQYSSALQAGQTPRAGRLLERIEEVLSLATGDAARIIADARIYSSETEQAAMRWADRVRQLARQMPEDPQGRKLMYQRLWAEAVEGILNSPYLEKYYLAPGNTPGSMVLLIPRDAEITRQIERERTKSKEQEGRKP